MPFLEDQIDRFALADASAGTREPGELPSKEDWLATLQTLLGHGPLAPAIDQAIEEEAYAIWRGNGEPWGTEASDWEEARRRFLEEDRLAGLIEQAIAVEANALWEAGGRLPGTAADNWFRARRRLIDDGRLLPSRIRDDLGSTLVLVTAGELPLPPPPGIPGSGPILTLDRPIYLAEHEVTIDLFARFVEQSGYRTTSEVDGRALGFDLETARERKDPEFHWRNPGYPDGPAGDHPVVQLTWDDAVAFCRWASDRLGASYRLPTEAEWRFAHLAARHRVRMAGGPPLAPEEEAWFARNSDRHPHPVGSKRADGIGLHDLLGNAAEWCADSCGAINKGDPDAPPRPGHPALGGSWVNTIDQLRPDDPPCYPPGFRDPSVGFRPCRDIPDVY